MSRGISIVGELIWNAKTQTFDGNGEHGRHESAENCFDAQELHCRIVAANVATQKNGT